MKTFKHILFFCQQYGKNLKKRWLSLLLLFIIPLILIAAIVSLALMIVAPKDREPIQLVIVDEDETFESKLMTQLLLLVTSKEEELEVALHDLKTSEQLIADGSITSYLVFPEGFTNHLYDGETVELELMGNPEKNVDSMILYELIESLSRYIESAQANIITLYKFTDVLEFTSAEKNKFFEEQFMNFMLFTLSKDNLLWEEEIENLATSNIYFYYSVAIIFALLSIWLLGIYLLLQKEESRALQIRMKLFGVTNLQRILGRSFWSVLIALMWSLLLVAVFVYVADKNLYLLDYSRIVAIMVLYSICYMMLIAMIDLLVRGMKIKMIVQMMVLLLVLIISGAIIPTIYFPISIQSIIPYTFPSNAFNWIVDLLIKERNYVEYGKLLLFAALMMTLLLFVSSVKERVEN